jgi:hypothetical protein
MKRTPRHRVFIGTQEIAGYYGRLRLGFEDLGVQAVFVDFSPDPFRYGGSTPGPWFIRIATALGRRRAQTSRANLVAKVFWTVLHTGSEIPVLVWAVARFDVFIFAFGNSILGIPEQPLLELPLLKLLRKRQILVFNGSDSRPPYMDGSLMASDRGRSVRDCIALTRQTKRRVARAERYADAIVVHGPHAQFFRRPFAQALLVGIPCVVPASLPSERRPGPLRILHAPSHPVAKGTEEVRRAIQTLRREGLELDYRELTGQSNQAVLRAIADCDFVIDQVYSDIPTPVFATEAAAYGKPAVVGGYAWQEVSRTISADDIPPVELCHPDKLVDGVRRLALDTEYRHDLGRRARSFVTERWAARAVASRYLRMVDEGIPPAWLGRPEEIRYVHGACISEARCRQLTRAVVAAGGPTALQLDHAPRLRALELEFAGRSG